MSDILMEQTGVENRCTAPTKRGPRCKNPLFESQPYLWSTDGTPSFLRAEDEVRFNLRLCSLHYGGPQYGAVIGVEKEA